jgi:hypothetical protein
MPGGLGLSLTRHDQTVRQSGATPATGTVASLEGGSLAESSWVRPGGGVLPLQGEMAASGVGWTMWGNWPRW